MKRTLLPSSHSTPEAANPLMQRYGSRMAFSARAVYIQRIITAALNFVLMVALARLLPPGEYGLALIVIIFTNYLAVLRDLGLSSSAIQAETLDPSAQSALFWYNAIATSTITLSIIALAPAFSLFYGQPALASMLIVSAFSFFVSGIGTQHAASLKREIALWKVSFSETSGVIIGFIATILAASIKMGAWSPIIGASVQNIATLFGYIWFARWSPSAPTNLRNHLGLLNFGVNTSIFNILNYSSYNIPTIIIGYLYGPEIIALFSRAQNLFMFPLTFLIIPMLQIIYPLLCRIREDSELTREVYKRTISVASMTLIPSSIIIAVLSPDIISFLFGPEWIGAGPILRWFCLALASFGILGPFGQFMASQSRTVELRNWGFFDFSLRGGAAILGATVSPLVAAAAFGSTSLLVIAPMSAIVCSRKGPITLLDQAKSAGIAIPACLLVGLTIIISNYALNYFGATSHILRILFISTIAASAWILAICAWGKTREIFSALLLRKSPSAS